MPLIRRFDPGFSSSYDVDPLRLFREMMKWDGLEEAGRPAQKAAFAPSADIRETPNEFVIHADLPGVQEKDVEITLSGNQLTVAGKRETELKREDEKMVSYERSFGSFSRTFMLPNTIDTDSIQADLRDGVLTVHVPKRPEVKARKIEVKGIAPKSHA